jgi:hypothetical protein
MNIIKWTRIKEHLIPSIIQEIDITCKKYLDLIEKIKKDRNRKDIINFYNLKKSISNRIEELENYFDDNLNNQRMLILEKGIIELKKILFYNPDINNELKESDLNYYRGLNIDLNKFGINKQQKNTQKNIKSATKANLKINNSSKKYNSNVNKKISNSSTKKVLSKEEESVFNNNNSNILSNDKIIIKKKIQIRLTDEEFRLLQKLRAQKAITLK